MAYATFTWPVSNQTTVSTRHRPIKAQFGGGYKQVAADGLQLPEDVVRVDVGPMEMTEATSCHNMLRATKGLPFQWTPLKPLPQVVTLWTCDDFQFRRHGGLIVGIQADFVVFNSA